MEPFHGESFTLLQHRMNVGLGEPLGSSVDELEERVCSDGAIPPLAETSSPGAVPPLAGKGELELVLGVQPRPKSTTPPPSSRCSRGSSCSHVLVRSVCERVRPRVAAGRGPCSSLLFSPCQAPTSGEWTTLFSPEVGACRFRPTLVSSEDEDRSGLVSPSNDDSSSSETWLLYAARRAKTVDVRPVSSSRKAARPPASRTRCFECIAGGRGTGNLS